MTRIFGGKDDERFWADKPLQPNRPKYKPKWWHIHWYNIPFNPIMKSPDGNISTVISNCTGYKCRCGKVKR